MDELRSKPAEIPGLADLVTVIGKLVESNQKIERELNHGTYLHWPRIATGICFRPVGVRSMLTTTSVRLG